MILLKRIGIFMVISISAVIGVAGCADDDSTAPNPPADTATVTDTGVDTGTGELEWDTTPLPGVNLMPNEEGFMKQGENDLAIQGAWYTFGCKGAVIDPLEGSTFTNPGRMCFSGTAPQVTDENEDGEPDWSDIWGAGMGFDTCSQSAEETDTEAGAEPTKYILSECPYNEYLATQLIGVSVRFRGYVNAAELRILFNEGINVANSYYIVPTADVAAATVFNVEFKDPLVQTHYNPDKKPNATNPDYIQAIQFQIPANADGPVDWDFCVEAISAITASDTDTDSDSDTAAHSAE